MQSTLPMSGRTFPQVFRLREGSSLDTTLCPWKQHDAAVRVNKKSTKWARLQTLLKFSVYARIDQRLASCREYVDLKTKLGGTFLSHTTNTSFMRPLSRGTVESRTKPFINLSFWEKKWTSSRCSYGTH
ncbi:hypothetical protein K439DRAFT_867534 [Ramaria rubella]|nr:hypothetical protein K439DRAFT_867534 [Ramaria rubella]